MTVEQRKGWRALEGRSVHVSLTDGSRIDAVALVSARGSKLWVFAAGEDAFIPVVEVIDVWEARPVPSAA